MKNLAFIILSLLLFCGCFGVRNPGADREVIGLKPVYAIPSLDSIRNTPIRPFDNLANIVSYNSYIYIVENNAGVHIINNTNPSNPVTISFIYIPGVSQITIDDDILFANFWTELLLIDISNPLEISVVNTIEDFYPLSSQNASPPGYSGSFECPDLSMGIIIKWEEVSLFDPQCWRD